MQRIFTPPQATLVGLGVLLLIGAGLRAYLSAGLVGALSVLKMLGTPAGIALPFLGIRLLHAHFPPAGLPAGIFRTYERLLWWLLGLVDLMLLAVIILGVPFLVNMVSER